MGLFDAFRKKDCEICGKEVGMFGYKKLEDGEICKDCVKLLSPWFDDRRHSTVDQIKRQIAAREENSKKLQTWNHNLSYGEYQKMYIRMENGVPESFIVTSADDYKEYNADIIPFTAVSSFDVDIRESHTELKRTNQNGEQVSYNPPRFEYSYDFYIKLMINGIEYIDDIRFKVNSRTLELETTQGHSGRGLQFGQAFDPMLYPEYREYKAVCDTITEIISCGQRGTAWTDGRSANTAQVSAASVAVPMPQSQPAAAWKCDACGSENTGKFCQGCGAAKPAPASSAAQGWKCFCGTVNTGRFCSECGTVQFGLADIQCSECSWTAEPGDVVIPTFCPNCGKRFNGDDI